jgi:dTDP-4-amino-4,6-dideoxygalactose transaminase
MGEGSRKRPGLERDLSEPVPVPESAIERATAIMRSGRLFRYGEFKGDGSEVAALEREFAGYLGRRFCVAMNSCGSTLFVALKCAGVQQGDPVLTSAFTLAPVPGAIEHAGARPVFVQCKADCTIDLQDLEQKARAGATVFLMSHMRGHLADMEAVQDICTRHSIMLIEDCAHTMGARWNGQHSGTFGEIACFSLQTFKHINAGEGGILVTDDEDMAARAILYSGSYMLYPQNGTPPPEEVFERHKYTTPNFSMRMQELTAALARPQIGMLQERAVQWRRSYDLLAERFAAIPHIEVPARPRQEDFVPSSIQFSITGVDADTMEAVLKACKARGVDIKWFGRHTPVGFTSTWQHWQFVKDKQSLPETDHMLAALCDMRIPVNLTPEDCQLIADIVNDAITASLSAFQSGPSTRRDPS